MDRRETERAREGPVPAARTIPQLLAGAVEAHGERPAQRYKGGCHDRSLVAAGVLDAAPDGAFATVTYADLGRHVRHLAAGFRALGVRPDDRVGILSETRMEWALADFALLAAGGVVTSLYPSASADRLRTLVDDAGLSGVVVEDAAAADRTLAVDDALGNPLGFVVVVDECDVADDRVLTLADVYDRGVDASEAAYESWLAARDASSLATLVYTSGTTGTPKGVRLTHGTLRANVTQCYRRFGPHADAAADSAGDAAAYAPLAPGGVALSYLPLAHAFERTVGHFLMLASGVTVAYAESPDTLAADSRLVRPTILTGVPRVYEKFYEAVRSEASSSPLRARLFAWAESVGRRHHAASDPSPTLRLQRRAADRLVFSRVRDALGGRLRYLISGGGRLSPTLCARYHAMGLPILEGYGLTETGPVVSVNPPDRPRVGTIGPPLPGVEVRLDHAAVPGGLGDGDTSGTVGELLVRGPNVADGYWNRPEETAAAFEDGWFRTGDVVERRADGHLVFRGRRSDVFALSTGKSVAPRPIEDAVTATPMVEQCLVVGEGRRFVAALVVPSVDGLREWAAAEGLDLPAARGELPSDARVRDRVDDAIARANERLEPHERIKRFRLLPEPFAAADGLLTATMKKRRQAILDRYAEAVDDVYASVDGSEFNVLS